MLAERDMVPVFPVTIMVYVPTGTPQAGERVRVKGADPLDCKDRLDGIRYTFIPIGALEDKSVTVPLKPSRLVSED
jgi:hypothetical protein